MTSKNSSLINGRNLQKQISARRLWLIAAAWLYMAFYYPVAVIMLIARSNQSAAFQHLDEADTLSQRLTEVSCWIGLRQSFIFVPVIFGAVIAIQGFSYLFSSVKTDFYESQPVSRMRRFSAIFWNGFFLFEIPLVVCMLLACVAAGAMGAMDQIVFLEAMISLARNTLIFLASYAMGILAVMLTGHIIVSGLMALFLLCFDWIFTSICSSYAWNFLHTYFEISPSWLISPVYNAMIIRLKMNGESSTWVNAQMTGNLLKTLLAEAAQADAALLAAAAVSLLLAVLLYRRRPAEAAGHSVLHAPVRFLVRVLIGTAAGLIAGNMVFQVFGTVSSACDTGMIFAILAGAILASGITEIVFAFDMKKFFRATWQIAAAGILAVIIFAVFRYDLTHYDSRLPAEESVESGAVYVYGEADVYYYPDDRNPELISYLPWPVLNRMEITDIDTLETIAADAMENTREGSTDYGSNGYSAIFVFRLKNGTTVCRKAEIPYDEDAALMDSIVGSSAYREAVFPVYYDEYIRSVENEGKMVVSNGAEEVYGSGSLYDGFAEAYRRDAEQYSYSLAASSSPVLYAGFTQTNGDIDQRYPVYECYTNTLEYLKENGLYLEPVSEEDVLSITVSRSSEDGSYQEIRYTDPEKIQEILENAITSGLYSPWMNADRLDEYYSADVYLKDSSVVLTLSFYQDSVPDFIQSDFE